MRRSMQVLLSAVLVILVSGCSLKNNLINENEPKIDNTLETIQADSIKIISDTTAIAFEWGRVEDKRVNGYNLYRGSFQENTSKLTHLTLIENRYSSHYVDKDLKPSTKYLYSFSSNGENGYESKTTKSFEVTTKNRPVAISFIQAISNLPRQVKVLWRPHSSKDIKYYKIERSTLEDQEWDKIETLDGRLQSEYIDTDLKDNYTYNYRVTAYTFEDIASDVSSIVVGKTKPLPDNINNLSATKNLPKKINLSWSSPENIVINEFKVYRNDSSDGNFTYLQSVPNNVNEFSDIINEDGKTYFYKVSVIDNDNLESNIQNSSTMGRTLQKLNKPIVTLAQIQGKKAILNWESGDSRTVNYIVYKVIKTGMFTKEEKKITGVNSLRFEDNDIVRGGEYKYSVQAVDKYGITSDRTDDSLLVLSKIAETK